ncbi:MAG: triosephosphate isomerase [Limisphaerales bacterium]|jgi:triosephosphate isomerase
MRRPLVAANWKMNGSLEFIEEFARSLKNTELASFGAVEVVVFPPAVYMAAWQAYSGGIANGSIAFGAQDVGISASGAHTGEIAAEMISDLGGRWAIVGHSERRIDQSEPDDLVATKAAAALRGGLRPIVCVGETLDERNAGHEVAVVERQLEAVLDRLDVSELAQGALAYEPVWAIGTGQTASPEQAQQMHAFIRDKIAHVDVEIARSLRVLYGGSVKPENAAELFGQEDIDGGLVGGAALDAQQFVEIVKAAHQQMSARD